MSETPAPRLGARTTPHRIQRLWHRIGYRTKAQHADAGFTLLEVVVSFIIFGIIAGSATLAIANGIGTSNLTKQRVAAANVAQQDIQQLEAMPRASVTAQPTSTTVTVSNEPFTITRSIANSPAGSTCPTAPASGTAHVINVHVAVSWPNSNGRSVQMDTVLAC